jgi:hypothetical protein
MVHIKCVHVFLFLHIYISYTQNVTVFSYDTTIGIRRLALRCGVLHPGHEGEYKA